MAKKGLTVKQQRFVDCYAGDVIKAAKIAGIAHGTARNLMTQNDIKAAIKGRVAKTSKLHIATREKRQAFWTKTMEGKLSKHLSYSDKLRASELLGKSEMDFTEKVDVNVSGELKIVDFSSLGKKDE